MSKPVTFTDNSRTALFGCISSTATDRTDIDSLIVWTEGIADIARKLGAAHAITYHEALAKKLKRLRSLEIKLREILLWGPDGRRKGHGPNVSMLGTEYEELCDLLGAPRR